MENILYPLPLLFSSMVDTQLQTLAKGVSINDVLDGIIVNL